MKESGTQSSYAALLLACCLVSFASFFSSYLRIPIVPLQALSLGANAAQVGAINGAFMLSAGLLSIPAGLLSDRIGRRTVILGGMLIIACSSFLLYFCTTPTEMIGSYLLFGVGLAAFSSSMMSYVTDIAPPAHMGRIYSLYTVSYNLAMMLGPAAGGFLGHALGLRAVFLISGGLVLFMFLAATKFLSPTQRSAPPGLFLPALGSLWNNTRFLACLLATLGGCFGFGMFMTFVPLHLKALGMNVDIIGLVFAGQALSNALSRIPFGYVIDHCTDRSRLVVAGLSGMAIALTLFGLTSRLPEIIACASLLGISMGISFTSLATLVAEAVPHQLRGLAMGGYNSSIYLGMMMNALTMGVIMSRFGSAIAFFLAGVITLIFTMLFVVLSRRGLSMGQSNLPADNRL